MWRRRSRARSGCATCSITRPGCRPTPACGNKRGAGRTTRRRICALPLGGSTGHAAEYLRRGIHAAWIHPRGVWRRSARRADWIDLAAELDPGDIRYLPPGSWLDPYRADRIRSLAQPAARGRSARRKRGRARRRRRLMPACSARQRPSAASHRAVLVSLAGGSGRPASALPLMRAFSAAIGVPGSSRALGWDTMLPTSSCGIDGCRPARSATPASRERRSGSTRSGISMSCC